MFSLILSPFTTRCYYYYYYHCYYLYTLIIYLQGVYIMEVVKNSPASNAGILPGDRILQINGIKVDKFEEEKMHEVLKKLNPTGIRMLINKR